MRRQNAAYRFLVIWLLCTAGFVTGASQPLLPRAPVLHLALDGGESIKGEAVDDRNSSIQGKSSSVRVFGSPKPTVDRFRAVGRAIRLNGTSDYAVVTFRDLPSGNSSRSISIWIRCDNFQLGNRFIAGWGKPVNPRQMCALVLGLGNKPTGKVGYWGWGDDFSVERPLENGVWHHLVFTFNGYVGCLFVDGALAASAKISPETPASSELYLGGFYSTMNRLSCDLDDLQIFDYDLDAQAVTALFRASETSKPRDSWAELEHARVLLYSNEAKEDESWSLSVSNELMSRSVDYGMDRIMEKIGVSTLSSHLLGLAGEFLDQVAVAGNPGKSFARLIYAGNSIHAGSAYALLVGSSPGDEFYFPQKVTVLRDVLYGGNRAASWSTAGEYQVVGNNELINLYNRGTQYVYFVKEPIKFDQPGRYRLMFGIPKDSRASKFDILVEGREVSSGKFIDIKKD